MVHGICKMEGDVDGRIPMHNERTFLCQSITPFPKLKALKLMKVKAKAGFDADILRHGWNDLESVVCVYVFMNRSYCKSHYFDSYRNK